MARVREPHEKATHEDLRLRVTQNQQITSHSSGATCQALFEKTLSLYRAYRAHGCLGPLDPFIRTAANNAAEVDEWTAQIVQSWRGHDPKLTCGGKIIFDYDHDGKAFVQFI